MHAGLYTACGTSLKRLCTEKNTHEGRGVLHFGTSHIIITLFEITVFYWDMIKTQRT